METLALTPVGRLAAPRRTADVAHLLSRRLGQLVHAGVVARLDDGKDVRYVLTQAGCELRPVVEALGVWGIRWIGELGDEDLDPKLLLWDMHRNIDHDAVPRLQQLNGADLGAARGLRSPSLAWYRSGTGRPARPSLG